MKLDSGHRAVDLGVAGFLALLPLLPTGPTYVGLDWPWALEVGFLLFLAVGLLVLLSDRAGSPTTEPDGISESVRFLRRGYLVWLVPVSAATVLALVERIPFDATFWGLETEGLIGRLLFPMDQAADPLYPLRVWLTAVEGGLMFWVLSVLLSRTPDRDRRARTAVSGCLWGVAMVSLVAIAQYFTGANLHEYWVRVNPNLTRSHATLDDPNTLASFLVLGVGLAGGIAWSGTAVRRASAAAVSALALMALVTTVSRAAWAGLLLAALTCAALLPGSLVRQGSFANVMRRTARGLGVLLVAAVLAWMVASVSLPKRTASVPASTPWEAVFQTVDPREPLETVLKGRLLWWRAGLDLAGNHRGLGAGLGTYPRFLATYPGTVGPENAHNYFIQVLAEVGTIGLFALGFFLVTIALAVWPSPDQAPPRIRMAMGLSAGLLGFVLTWVTGHPLLTLSNQLWLATVLAVGVAAVGVSTMSERPKPAPQTGRTWLHARAWLLHRFWVPGTIMLTLAVAAPRVVVAARSGSPASYAAGVYAWESGPATEGAPADTRFRWTRGRAAVREPVRGTVLAVPFYLARPLPATLYARIGGVTLDPVTFSRTGWHSLSYDLGALLGEEQWRSERVITVEFRVSPTFVPAQAGESDDVRELGVGLGVPSWSGRNSLAPTPP